MINRKEAFDLLKKYLREDKLVKHSLAVEAILIDMAKKLGEDDKLWGVIGLLHDLDYEYTKREPEKHANLSTQILEGLLPDTGLNAIKAHNYTHTDYIPTTSIDKALIAADAVSGLIIATALIIPSKKLSDIKIETLINKYKDNSFARGCSRNRIALCLDAGIEIDKFLALSLNALKGISDSLGL
jgi:putative nucleotidyltransferase with HDIG domain